MDIEEIKKLRAELEIKISNLINSFQEETAINVDYISLTPINEIQNKYKSKRVEIMLNIL